MPQDDPRDAPPQPPKRKGCSWTARRYQLARRVFGRPVPFLTEKYQIKRGDFLITLPVVVALVSTAVSLYNDNNVSSSGTIPSVILSFIMTTATRNGAPLRMIAGISLERSLWYHKLLVMVFLITGGIHGLCYLDNRHERDQTTGELRYDDDTATTGAIAFGGVCAILPFALPFVRRRFFELFLRAHWILFILVIIFSFVHGAGVSLLPGVIPWVIDLLIRFVYRRRKYHGKNGPVHASQVTFSLMAGGLVRVQFPRVGGPAESGADVASAKTKPHSFNYVAGQYLFLCVPKISALEWHPFSIASAPHEPMVTLYIKPLGDWTKKLANLVECGSAQLPALVDGPYGSLAIDMTEASVYTHVAFISGGIGITPMLSLANQLYLDVRSPALRQTPLMKAHFLWSGNEPKLLDAVLLKKKKVADPSTSIAGNHMSQSIQTPIDAQTQYHRWRSLSRDVEQAELTWIPGQLQASACFNTPSDLFYTELYLPKESADLTNPLDQRLGHALKFGQRMDVAKSLWELGRQAAEVNKSRVGVMVCGPEGLKRAVIRESMRVAKECGVAFDVHSETFAF